MQRAQPASTVTKQRSRPELVLAPHLALSLSATAGVRLFARRTPVHSVLLGRCQIEYSGALHTTEVVALPANTANRVHAFAAPHAAAAYFDARRYRFEDVLRIANRWRGFVPGRDDLQEAFGDALCVPQRRVDGRLLRALDAIDGHELSVADAARRVGLSESRLTHLMSDTLGAPPRSWRAWLRLRRALAEVMFGRANLTQAAHRAGFADSAHLTRTCKQLTGVLPSPMLPQRVHVWRDD
jgi:AraC-like DNA-binding protein